MVGWIGGGGLSRKKNKLVEEKGENVILTKLGRWTGWKAKEEESV